jgi:hypothetical protein
MQKPKTIQLNVASPCHEDWGAMTQQEKGRFCGQCQKTVIDFTTWSDTDLFQFFTKQSTGNVCGRFFRNQLQKELHLPPQPKSRLYRIAIACGLTLMFAQVPEVHAMVKQPTELLSSADYDGGGEKDEATGKGVIRGRITDKKGKPQQDVIVEVKINGETKGSATTDKNGRYIIKELAPGQYTVSTIYIFTSAEEKTVKVTTQKESFVNFVIEQIEVPVMGIVQEPVQGGVMIEPVEPPTPPPAPQIEKGKVKVR